MGAPLPPLIPCLLPRAMRLGGGRSSGHSVPPVLEMSGVSSEATPTMLAPFKTREEEGEGAI